ncbi:MAG: nucleotidyltransferase domain-containing protein [Acidobacteriota bacterium]|nr:nucleotidyltransferase domain-containing protein [Acidobacteriota bacterium]
MTLPGSKSLRQNREHVFSALRRSCEEVYGERLMTVAIFGSAGRDTARPDSDLDLLLVADPLPNGRMRRVDEFAAVEKRLSDLLPPGAGSTPLLSPVLKTTEEVGHGSPLFLDMTEDARILFDRGSFFARELDRLRERLANLGARRVWLGNAWYWDLKPDYRPGDVFEL